MPRKKEYSRLAVAADAILLTHFILCIAVVIIGELTSVFDFIDFKHGGVRFVLEYIDAPIYQVLAYYMPIGKGNWVSVFGTALAVICLSSVVYAAISYFILRFFASIFKPDLLKRKHDD